MDQIKGLGIAVENLLTAEPISLETLYKLRQSGNLILESRKLKTEFLPGDPSREAREILSKS
jgi:hypothetical protein